jgi:hypothetical protein
MTVRRLGMLQWVGLVLGGAAWAVQHMAGLGVTQAACSRAGAAHGIDADAWQLALMVAAAACVLVAEAASIAVLRETEGVSYEGDPPLARIRFFAVAASVVNLIFLVVIILDGVGAIASASCTGGST